MRILLFALFSIFALSSLGCARKVPDELTYDKVKSDELRKDFEEFLDD